MITPRFSIRAKLLLVSLTLLAVPWVGLSFVKEVERALRQGHEQSVAATAQAVATALHDRPRLFEPQPGHASPWHEPGDLYLFALPAAMEVDGAVSDWPATLAAHTYTPPPTSESASSAAFKLRLGQHGAYVYALIEVTDAQVHYRAAQNSWLESADHVEFALTTPEGEFKRFTVSPLRPGTGAAYAVQFQDGKLALGEPEPRIRTVWRETPGGYNVELSLPQSLLGEKLSFAIAEVSAPESGINAWISTSIVTQREGMGRLIVPSPEIQQVVQGLGRATSRIRVVDKSQRVIAEMGSLKQAQQALAPIQPLLLERIKANTLRPIYARLLQQPTDAFTDDTAKASRLETREIESALRGVPQTGRRATMDGQAVIVSSAHPIWVQDQIIGAAVTEETTNSVLTLRNQALEKLFTSVLAVFLIVALGMLLFASRLSYRIRKLSNEAEAAIDAKGRVVGGLKQSALATDEIGDLSRSFSSVLARLGQYNHYLENMASRLSHELRTPIAVVRSSLDNLAQQSVPDEARIYMERAQDGIRRLNTLLTRMTEARQLEQALQNTERETFDLIPVVAGCVEGYRGAYPDVAFNLRIPSEPILLSGGPDLIAQMLDKLISNAVDFHRAESSIDIALACEKQHAVLTLSNEGPPLPAEMAGQLFQSMVSVRPRQTDDEPHLGFGLYIARLIAEYHGGGVRAENRKDGAGVVMTVTLPVV
ncbi:MAG: proteobacterial dedicated sortase system histidine kinase [Burkholderiales bacterium]|nr:proteobacterial dedicated sortase system histidine kinase [Burkholderiales bacterium]